MINIDTILKEKRLTKTIIAKRMGLSRESLYRILSGNPTLDNLNKLSAALEIPLSDLFDSQNSAMINCPHCGKPIKVLKG